jgi:Ser/Thr protein kinase RdoA (MazF antagonist)
VHANYGLRTADGGELVLKVYSGELSWKRDKEAFLLRLVADRIPAPEVVHEGAGFLLMTRLPGTPARFSDADPVEVSRRLGRLLRDLHAIAFDSFGYIDTRVTSPLPTNLEYMRRRIDAKVRSGPPELRDSLQRYFTEHEAAFEGCTQAVLCHNDAHDANVLVEGGRITGLIDWENAVAADPIFDLATAWAFSDGRSDETLAALTGGYGPLRADWHDAFDLYVVDHLLELWIWFHQLGVIDPLPELEGHLARRVGA